MKKHLATAALLNIFISTLLVAQPYPHLWNIQVSANIWNNRNEQMFYYKYAVTNAVTNIGKIERFEIDISRNANSLEIDTVGLKFEDDGFIEKSFRRQFPFLEGKIIPVGLYASPGNSFGFTWTGGFSNNLTAGWGADSALIERGQSLSGFVLMSKGLPGIRRCIVSPYFDVIALFPDPADTTITYYVPPVDSVREAVKFRGWTIGPTAPPANFDPVIWCDTLISYKHQAFALGWIKNQGIIQSLDAKLENAKRQLLRNNRTAAKNMLQAFVNEVEAQKDKHLTSEAYALLKFNAEYLISKL